MLVALLKFDFLDGLDDVDGHLPPAGGGGSAGEVAVDHICAPDVAGAVGAEGRAELLSFGHF